MCCLWFIDVLWCDKVRNVKQQNAKTTKNTPKNIKITIQSPKTIGHNPKDEQYPSRLIFGSGDF